ncbi:MAG: EF-P lysine aminoacylase EpmA [Dissulfuribacterales bacterium]
MKRLRQRALILQAVRNFFISHDFLEVQTPVLVSTLAPEPYIEAIEVPFGNNDVRYLITSPELNLKRLVAEGLDHIFQITPAFRKNERGTKHLIEFTLLEWYSVQKDYIWLMEYCEELIRYVASVAGNWPVIQYGGIKIRLDEPFYRISIQEAFAKWAGWDPVLDYDAYRFDLDMVEQVEPNLPVDRPVFLFDYPIQCAALARRSKRDGRLAERVELYAGGLELANGYSELTDAEEQTKRFQQDFARMSKIGRRPYPWPAAFLKSIKRLLPCAGMAMGLDRLVMVLTDAMVIDDVVACPSETI